MNPHLTVAVDPFRKWLHLPDLAPVYAVLATYAANRMKGDPVWLLLVGPPSSGKTEILESMSGCPNIHAAATMTEPALLSGTPSKEKAKDARGGLLRVIGDFGIISCKDFGSVISQQKDTQAATLAALREVYDGAWTRHVGTEGGRTLEWRGKVGLIGGCTPTIDRRHAVMSQMGERFIFCRLNVEDDAALARAALKHVGHEARMRAELAGAVAHLFTKLDLQSEPPMLLEDESARLVALSSFVVKARSAVERDGHHMEIVLIPDAEAPGRLTLVLARLLAGLSLIGLPRAEAWRVVERVALDSMPALRRKMIDILTRADGPLDTTDVALAAQYPTTTARRQLEELAAYGVVERTSNGRGNADEWNLTPWSRARLTEFMGSAPEIPTPLYNTNTQTGKSGTVPINGADRYADL